jgi:hypothetical protein
MNAIKSIIKTNETNIITRIYGPGKTTINIIELKLVKYSDCEYELNFQFDHMTYNMRIIYNKTDYLFKYKCNYWPNPIIDGVILPELKVPIIEFINENRHGL